MSLFKHLKILASAAICLACPLIIAPAAAEDVFILPHAFTTPTNRPFSLALTESDSFPNLGHPPAGAPGMTQRSFGTSVWDASGAISTDPSNYSAWSLVVLTSDELAARYIYEPERRGWVKLSAELERGTETLEGDDARAFLDSMYMTPDERAAFVPPSGAILVERSLYAMSFVCVRRCDELNIIGHRDNAIRAHAELGLRAFWITVYMQGRSRPAPDAPIELVTATERRTLRTDANGLLLVPEDIHGVVMLSQTLRRPPAAEDRNYLEYTRTLTFELP